MAGDGNAAVAGAAGTAGGAQLAAVAVRHRADRRLLRALQRTHLPHHPRRRPHGKRRRSLSVSIFSIWQSQRSPHQCCTPFRGGDVSSISGGPALCPHRFLRLLALSMHVPCFNKCNCISTLYHSASIQAADCACKARLQLLLE